MEMEILIIAFVFLFIAGILALILWVLLNNKGNLRKAALALGDDFYVTGVPNTVWKKYARSFPEYKRLLHALAQSGDYSPSNVHNFVNSFTDGSGSGSVIQDNDQIRKTHGHNDTNSGSDFTNPYSVDSLTFLGSPTESTSAADISSHYNRDSDIGHSPGSGY